MLRKEPVKGKKEMKVTFIIQDREDLGKVSVAGDFNNWQTGVHRLVRRPNGTRSAAVLLPRGNVFRYRYFSDTIGWFNDEAADGYEPNEFGTENCLVVT